MPSFKLASVLIVSLSVSLTMGRPSAQSQPPASAPSNPLTVASAVPLGDRLPTNDQSIRDLGYQGNIGNIWINTFGDGVGCKNASTQDGCGANCAYLTGRDGGAVQSDNPLQYTDYDVRTDLCNGVPQMGPFCPILAGETTTSGLGITNVVEVNSTHGLLLTRPTFSTSLYTPGAGFAVVDVSSGTSVCTRPYGINSWGSDEPNWGQLSSIINGGYIYTYANGPKFGSSVWNSTVLARVPQAQAFDINAYQYYHGDVTFNSDRIYMSKLTASSPELLVGGENSQGHVIYSQYYQKYIMFGAYISFVQAMVADNPWGPWSTETTIYTPATTKAIIYSPNVQEKFVDPLGKWFLLTYSDANTLPVVNITWA